MKRLILILALYAALTAACADTDSQLRQRAAELCQYIPDHELLDRSREYLTADFYAALDTMFNLPDSEPLDHEWLYYFVTGNGGTIANYEVKQVVKTDPTHATATILVRQQWEDGSFDQTSDVEEHLMDMEKIDGQWLMADFDGHKQDCLRHIQGHRKEQAIRDAINAYLADAIGTMYRQGDICVPSTMIVHIDDSDSTQVRVWCDCWVYWYALAGDTLRTVSGGNHSGCFTLRYDGGQPTIAAFEQTTDGAGYEASAKRIFGAHYDIYLNMHSNPSVGEAARECQLQIYLQKAHLDIRYYQDYGRAPIPLSGTL